MANIPSYMLIRQYVIDLLFRHAEPEHPLPSEHELAHRFGVSRTTIRLALNDLVKDGCLIRKNRSGMYLAPDYAVPTAGRYKKILLLIGDGKYAFLGGNILKIYAQICAYFSRREYRLVAVNLNSDFPPAGELGFYRPDGVLWIQPEPGLSPELRRCAERFPLQVLFGYDQAMPNSSCVDYAGGAKTVTAWFRKAGVTAPYLIGAGDSPIRRPFTEMWKALYPPGRAIPIMHSGEKELSELFGNTVPNGIFCFGSEFSELRRALPVLPEYTITDSRRAGSRHALELFPAGEITRACRALEKQIGSPARSRCGAIHPVPCRIIRPGLLHVP